MADRKSALKLDNVVRTFAQAGETVHVLKGVDLVVNPGETVALVGPSGSGKSTLLQIAGLLEPPTSGNVAINAEDSAQLDDNALTALRRNQIGFVYQFHYLLPEFDARENIIIPQMIAGKKRKDAAIRADELLELVGLGNRATHRPARLSGGEKQRVAIARALANDPALLLADEPTGNLDPSTSESVFAVLMKAVRDSQLGALIATHNLELAARMDRTLELRDGKIVETTPQNTPESRNAVNAAR